MSTPSIKQVKKTDINSVFVKGLKTISEESSSSKPGSTPLRPPMVNLFNVDFKVLSNVPLLKDTDKTTYEEWKRKLNNWARENSIWDIIFKPVDESASSAMLFCQRWSIPDSHAQQLYDDLHSRLWAILCRAIEDSMGSTISEQICQEQRELNRQGLSSSS